MGTDLDVLESRIEGPHGLSQTYPWEVLELITRLREAEGVIGTIQANAVELLDADDDSYDGSLSATWVIDRIATYNSINADRG